MMKNKLPEMFCLWAKLKRFEMFLCCLHARVVQPRIEMHQHNTLANEISNIVMAKQCQNHDLATLEEYIQNVIHQQPPDFSKWSIYRVPKRLLNLNSKAYTPEVIAIGPFHHGREDLLATKPLKVYCLNSYLHRINCTVEDVVVKARGWESQARSYYAEPISMESDDFVKMLLVDGCFIMELLIIANNNHFVDTQNGFDLSFFKAIWFDINRDLIMLENQLPFFVLQDLFDLFPQEKKKDGISFIGLMAEYLSNGLIGHNSMYKLSSNLFTQQVDHFIDLLSLFFIPSSDTNEYRKNIGMTRKFLLPPTVSELSKASVKVKKATKAKSLLDISFQNGVLEIPPFEIHDEFEIYVRNLMAFEHYRVLGNDKKNVLDYIEFLDGLISTEEDVALLVKAEIIINHIGGSNKEVSQMFNNLCKYTPVPHDFYYYGASKDLHDYCRKWWHRSMATLRRDYFNSPWACISFVAATVLILLTFLQTVFSGLSIPKK